MHRRFDVDLYRSESAGWNVEKFINVAVATGRHSIDETIAVDRDAPAAGGPDAIIGGLPPADTVAESLQFIDHQMTVSRFRGVRPMGRLDQPLPAVEVLRGLQERNLVFEFMTHPDQLGASAVGLSGFDDLTVGLLSTRDGPARTPTRSSPSGSRASTHLPPSGLTSSASCPDWPCPSAPWRSMLWDPGSKTGCSGAFGVDRCFFASNFPVDAVYGTFDELYTAFSDLTAGLDDASRAKLFAENAERIYRL